MKKIYYLLVLASFTLNGFAQPCIPDITLTKPGIKPDKIADAIVGTPYSQVATIFIPRDTVINYNGNVYNAVIDSASIVGMNGLPAGFLYECDKASKTWAGGTRGCARLYGSPTAANLGSYAIYVKVRTFFRIVGLPNQLDQLDSSIIDFKVVMPNALEEFVQMAGLKTYPNPANNQLNVVVKNYSSNASYQIFNIFGQAYKLEPLYAPNTGEIKFDISSLAPGVYFVKGENEGRNYQAKFVKE